MGTRIKQINIDPSPAQFAWLNEVFRIHGCPSTKLMRRALDALMEAFPDPKDFRFNFAVSEKKQESALQLWLNSVPPEHRAKMIVDPTPEETARLEAIKKRMHQAAPREYPERLGDAVHGFNEERAPDHPVTKMFSEPAPETKKPSKSRGGQSRGGGAKRRGSAGVGDKS